mmetsp:Transcript_9698/g.27723  ORF Transcript_9698/g.27723 Transcript_9698/m.27723 type:complete len:239 (-) Transcript_9698:813-1529(-)
MKKGRGRQADCIHYHRRNKLRCGLSPVTPARELGGHCRCDRRHGGGCVQLPGGGGDQQQPLEHLSRCPGQSGARRQFLGRRGGRKARNESAAGHQGGEQRGCRRGPAGVEQLGGKHHGSGPVGSHHALQGSGDKAPGRGVHRCYVGGREAALAQHPGGGSSGGMRAPATKGPLHGQESQHGQRPLAALHGLPELRLGRVECVQGGDCSPGSGLQAALPSPILPLLASGALAEVAAQRH